MGTEVISVGIIEDQPVTRSGLASIVHRAADLTLLGMAGSIEEYGQLGLGRCTVILLDLELPGISGPAAVKVASSWTDAVLIVSGSEAFVWVGDSLRAGACGYLNKSEDEREIVEAVHAVADGHKHFTASMSAYVLNDGLSVTPRQRDILQCKADGLSDQGAADRLGISREAVRHHLDRIGERTGLRRTPDLFRLIRLLGIKPRS